MATLSQRLQTLTATLTEKYGNTITLVDGSAEGWYDPQTGSKHISSVTYTKFGSIKDVTNEELKVANIPDNILGSIRSVVTLAFDDDIASIGSKWTVNGMAIHKVITVSAQDTKIMVKLFVG